MAAGVGDRHAGLCADLRLLRLHGVPSARRLDVPWLVEAAEQLGHRPGQTTIDLALEALLRQAVGQLGESGEATSAACSFGLSPGQKLWKAADRRRAAAQAQGVSVETFRKSYELALIEQLANEILGLVTAANGHPVPTPTGTTVPPPTPTGPPVERIFQRDHHIADLLRTAHANADWDLVEGVYKQCVQIADDHAGRFLPDAIPAFFAEALGRMSANYHGREAELILHGLGIMGNAEHATKVTPELFRKLYTDDRFDRFAQYATGSGENRRGRRPYPFETLVETARRFRDLIELQAVLADLPTSGVLGGSVNYGRYFNVRGVNGHQAGASIDLMLVIPDFRLLDDVIGAIERLPGASRASVGAMRERAATWRENQLDDGYTLFSQRIDMWSDEDDPVMAWAPNRGEYLLDLRIVSTPVLNWILVVDNPKLTASSSGNSRLIRDFCEHESRRDEHQRSFSGRNLRANLDVTSLGGNLLRTHRVYSITEDRYYPGSVQNLILPRFNKRWDDVPIRGTLEAFRWKIIERLRYERRRQPYELLRVSLSHTRSEAFAPHILRSVDSSDLT